MTTLFPLYHEYENEFGEDESKYLGLYSTRERAEEAIERYKKLSGFRDHPRDCFKICEAEVDRDAGWTDGFFHAVVGEPDPENE